MADGTHTADHGFVPLDEATCWELLGRVSVGRLAWADPDGRVMVVPVNFGLDGRMVVVRTGRTALLAAARARTRCGLQADDLEPGLRSGWTVLVDGRLAEVQDEAVAERLGLLVDPWLRQPRPHVLSLAATQVTGRMIEAVGDVRVVAVDADGHDR